MIRDATDTKLRHLYRSRYGEAWRGDRDELESIWAVEHMRRVMETGRGEGAEE